MTYRDIYEGSLRLLAESTAAEDTADYEERAQYLLACFCKQTFRTDASLRRFLGEEQAQEPESLYVSLDSVFPLLSEFSVCAALYLASMLAIGDFPELSDKLYERYHDLISRIYESLPGVSESTSNKYF